MREKLKTWKIDCFLNEFYFSIQLKLRIKNKLEEMSEELGIEFVEAKDCNNWFKYLLDGFVIIKAVILIMISLCAVRWYSRSEMHSCLVIAALLVSCAVVAFELFYRYS